MMHMATSTQKKYQVKGSGIGATSSERSIATRMTRTGYLVILVVLMMLIAGVTFVGRAVFSNPYRALELPPAVMAQIATETAAPSATFTPTAIPPGANTWKDSLVLIPDSVDPTYKYLPPQDVVDRIHADWDDAVIGQILNPPWDSNPELRARYYYMETTETPTPTANPKSASPTPIGTMNFLGIGTQTFRFVGCDVKGEVCRISDVWQQNYVRVLDFRKRTITRGNAAPDKLTFVNLRWDEHDAHWKMLKGTLSINNLAVVTTTPKPVK